MAPSHLDENYDGSRQLPPPAEDKYWQKRRGNDPPPDQITRFSPNIEMGYEVKRQSPSRY